MTIVYAPLPQPMSKRRSPFNGQRRLNAPSLFSIAPDALKLIGFPKLSARRSSMFTEYAEAERYARHRRSTDDGGEATLLSRASSPSLIRRSSQSFPLHAIATAPAPTGKAPAKPPWRISLRSMIENHSSNWLSQLAWVGVL